MLIKTLLIASIACSYQSVLAIEILVATQCIHNVCDGENASSQHEYKVYWDWPYGGLRGEFTGGCCPLGPPPQDPPSN